MPTLKAFQCQLEVGAQVGFEPTSQAYEACVMPNFTTAQSLAEDSNLALGRL